MSVRIEVYEPGMRPGILEFARDYGLIWGTEPALFSWKYERTLPAVCPSGIPRLWVLKKGQRVLGMLGTQPVTVVYRAERRSAAYAVDFHVHPELRGRGLGAALLQRFRDTCSFHLMAFATDLAHRIYLRKGYTEIPGLESFSNIRPTARTATRLLAGRLGRKTARPQSLSFLAQRLAAAMPGCVTETGDDPDALDDFLERCQLSYEFATVRDWETLRWRYLEHPFGAGAVFSQRRESGRREVVFALAWRRMRGLHALALCDLYFEKDSEDSAAGVVEALPRLAKIAGADFYTTVALPVRIKRLIADSRKRTPRLFSVWIEDADPKVFSDFTNWYVMGGDSDFIT
jgi:hypothetical protein